VCSLQSARCGLQTTHHAPPLLQLLAHVAAPLTSQSPCSLQSILINVHIEKAEKTLQSRIAEKTLFLDAGGHRPCAVNSQGPGRWVFCSPHHAALRASRISLVYPGGGRTQPRRYASWDEPGHKTAPADCLVPGESERHAGREVGKDRLSPKAPGQTREIRRVLDGLQKTHRPGPD